MADYVVLRLGAGLPESFMPPGMNGRWYDRATFPLVPRPRGPLDQPEAVAVPTGRFEVRDDGAVAEVWEFQQ